MKKPVQQNASPADTLKIAPAATAEAIANEARPKLTLLDLWNAGREIGLHSPDESTQIVRKMRDNRY